MGPASTICRVHQCSKCPGDTSYKCESCPCDLCPQCKESHEKDLKTIDHNVSTNREYNNMRIQTAYIAKRQQHIRTIHTIKSEALFYRPVLLSEIKSDINTFHKKLSHGQSDILSKARKLKHLVDNVLYDLLHNVFCDFNFKHRCLKQEIKMYKHISRLQKYVHIYEQWAIRPLQFLSFIKKALPQIHLTLHTNQLYMSESLNKEDVMASLSAIRITERKNRRVGNQCLLKLMSVPEFHQSLTVTSVDQCLNISCVTSDRVWVSDGDNLILTNITGATIHRVEDSCIGSYGGSLTVNSESELIYIDVNYNINTLSKDMKSTSRFIEKIDYLCRPQCVYWCPSTGDLLVGMYINFRGAGKVIRYNQSGKETQTIQYDNTGMKLYNNPICLTENNNGDVVVSDAESIPGSGAVVVTERKGRHRYSYTGHPPGSFLYTRGICTDALSHILVCDHRSKTVQMLDKDGHFLSHLLIRPPGIFTPHSLSYHTNTHRLWVGSVYNNKLCVYRYIARHDTLSDMNPASAGVMESLSVVPYKETKKHLQEDERLLKLMSTIELFNFLTRQGVEGCYHISYVISNLVWVSDANNLILADTGGVHLHHVDDLCRDLYGGTHTVNSESELFYIDRNYNINKLSKNMKTTTTIIEKKDSTWLPGCVYWSPSTRDLLVGMFREKILSGKVNRFNQSGQQTLTIQHDSTGLDLYRYPNYITENNNGDIVVSDSDGAIVVTDREGIHRFSYTGHPPGSGLDPRGICTDVLSHILVCDVTNDTVHMLDKDGHFLSYLLTKSQDIDIPCSLSYDVNTHRLWIGSWYNNKVCVYRFTDRHDALTDEHTDRYDGEAFSCSSPAFK